MGLMLFLLVFVLVRVRITSQQTSSEDINKILEKLIRQTANNGTDPAFNGEPYFPVPIDTDTEAGNDSNIYYFKTYMAPHIKLKNDSETPPVTRRSNKTVKNIEVNTTYDLSEDELITGTPETRSGPNNSDTESPQDKSGEIDKNFNMLEDLFQKDIKKKSTTERSPYGHIPAKPLSLLHDYPEIVIDHISYNNEKDKPRPNPQNAMDPQDTPSEQIPVKDNNDGYTTKPVNQKLEPISKQMYPENDDSKSDPDMKALIDKINKAVQNEREPNKQSDLLKKILDRLPDKQKEDVTNIEPRSLVSYPIELNALSNDIGPPIPIYLGNLQHNVVSRLSTTYMRAPILAQTWTPYRRAPIGPYLTRGLLGVVRPETLQRRRLVTALVRRVMPRYTFRRTLPVFYGL